MSLMSLVSASLDSQFLISEKNPFSFLFYLLLSRFVFQVSFVSLSSRPSPFDSLCIDFEWIYFSISCLFILSSGLKT